MKKGLCWGLGISLVLFCGTFSFAQNAGLDIHGLYAFNIDGEIEDVGEVDFDDVFTGGAALVFCLGENAKLDIGADYLAWEDEVGNDLTLIPICGTLRLGGNLDSVFLYGGGGVGYSINDYDVSGVDLENNIIFFACGGAEFGLSEKITLKGEFRYNWFEPELEVESTGDKYDWTLDHMQIRGGLTFYF